MRRHDPTQVAQFGNLRVKACSGSPKLIAAVHVLHRTVYQGIPDRKSTRLNSSHRT